MWLILLGVVIFLYILLHILIPKKYNSLKAEWEVLKIPGPRRIPYFGNAHLFFVPNEEFLPVLDKLVKQYEPIFRVDFLGYLTIFCMDATQLEIILNSRKHITKSDDYEVIKPWLGTGLLTATKKKWFDHRKWLTPAFHFGILEQYIDIINKNANTLVEQLMAFSKDDYVSINPIITLCTLDIICETAMGTVVDAQRGGEKEYVKATLRMSQIFQIRQLTPYLHWDWIFKITSTGREHEKWLKVLHGFTKRVIQERKKAYKENQKLKNSEVEFSDVGEKKKISFLDLLIEMSEKENKMTEEEIREEVDTFMFEGHDTTSAALCWTLFELGSNPDIQEKAYQELQEIFGDSDRQPTNSDLAEMKYLERVIKETLRLYPSVPVISRRLEEEIKIKDYVFPAGTYTPIFIYKIHRDPRFYPDPEKFDPDRFLPEKIQGRHPYSYIPFSAGPRNCIGQRFALMEEKVILSQVLRKFQITSLDKKEDIKMMAELILRPKDNLRIVFKPRQR
uniref:Cytochrome P450 n=1 Tax=Liposcelis entomophila TaxID=550478 RepID=A0A0U3YU92_9NEOP|nr:cytochrome P450 [Liposcelis entomophila]